MSEQKIKTIYNLCGLDSEKSPKKQCDTILGLLKEFNSRSQIKIDKAQLVPNTFLNNLNRLRNNTQTLNLKLLLSDGKKCYQEYQTNESKEQFLTSLQTKCILHKHENIPKKKYIKTKNGFEYNIDELVNSIILRNSPIEPADVTNTLYIWDTQGEEEMIIGHPGLDQELKDLYILQKEHTHDKNVAIFDIFRRNPKILDYIGEYGLVLLNFKLDKDMGEQSHVMINKLLDIVGNDDYKILLEYMVVDMRTINSILQECQQNSINTVECGYYLVLMYLQCYYECYGGEGGRGGRAHNLLPYFTDMSEYSADVLYIGTCVVPEITATAPNMLTIESAALREYKHVVILFLPQWNKKRLFLSNMMIMNDNVVEEFGEHKKLDPNLMRVIQDQGFTNPNLTVELYKLYAKLHSGLNQ